MDPRHDPRIVHIWQDRFPQTLCGILEDDYPRYENLERLYQCYGCQTILTGRTPVPPPEWFTRHA